MTGKLERIYVAPGPETPVLSLIEARAIPGAGLEGDRYFLRTGTFCRKKFEPNNELTLIEAEAIEALEREHGIVLAPGDARRNLVTRGIALNDLVSREFRVGEIRCRGLRLCPPCGHMERLTAPGVHHGLAGRGGLRAQILTAGVIRVGDIVCDLAASNERARELESAACLDA